jgi:very-short-patch-repair endonuclease
MDAKYAEAARIASDQNGRITTEQLRDCGIRKSSIEKGVDAGRLHRVHRGVFALGHLAPNRLADAHAAVLAAGEGARLSRRWAATFLQIRDGIGRRVDVTVPPSNHRERPGIDIRRSEILSFEAGTFANIPITSPARTMVDLAHELQDRDAIEWAMREMQFRRLYDHGLLELSNRRRPNRFISALLQDLAPTGSPLEVAFLNRVVRRHALPTPVCQAQLEGFRVDFLWDQAGLVVEVDGKNHDQPMMRLADAHRDAILRADGYVVLRYRWADIHRHDERTARQIRHLLDA